jgi:heat shock protein HslJ
MGANTTSPYTNTNAPMKAYLNLNGSTGTFIGYTGCNRISGKISTGTSSATSGSSMSDGSATSSSTASTGSNSISFTNVSPATSMPCAGGVDEQAFLSTLQRVNSYSVSNDQLQLMEGSTVLLVFSKNNNQ